MSESERDLLIGQLSGAESVAERRQAAKKLGELRDPSVIEALVNTYLDENEDESVRRAAESALRLYRRLQQERDRTADPLTALEAPAPSLQRFRTPLAISLAVLIGLNLLLVIVRGLSGAPPIELIAAQPSPVLATSRAALIIEAQSYLNALSAELAAFRQPLLDLQANVEALRRLPRCGSLSASQVSPRSLLPEDARAQPDLAAIFESLNAALDKFRALRVLHAELCAQTDLAAIDQRLQPEGGAAGLVAQLDALINREIGAARLALEAASARTPDVPSSPAANLPASPSLTPPLMPRTEATSPSFAESSPTAPEMPLAPPTAALVLPTAPPIANITYQGVRLAERARFRYRLTVDYEALTPQNRNVRGALSLRVLAENSPTPSGRFEIGVRDDPEVGAFRDWLPEPFYRQGNAFYTALNGVFYHIGAGVPPQTLCLAEPFSPANVGALASLNVDGLISRLAPPNLLAIWREMPPVGGKPQYRAEFATQDADGVRISLVATLVLALDGSVEQLTIRETRQAPSGYAKVLLRKRTLVYTLQAADAAFDLSEVARLLELPCRTLTPNAP